MEEKWDLKKDIEYNKNVEAANFDESRNQWQVECSDGSEVYCRWFIPAIGFAAKRYTPPIKGLSDFQGEVYRKLSHARAEDLLNPNIRCRHRNLSAIWCQSEGQARSSDRHRSKRYTDDPRSW